MSIKQIDSILKPVKQIGFIASILCIFLVLAIFFQVKELREYLNNGSIVASFTALKAPIIIYLGVILLSLIVISEVLAAVIFTICCRITRINCHQCNEKMKVEITNRVYLICPHCESSHKMHYMGYYGRGSSDAHSVNNFDSGF